MSEIKFLENWNVGEKEKAQKCLAIAKNNLSNAIITNKVVDNLTEIYIDNAIFCFESELEDSSLNDLAQCYYIKGCLRHYANKFDEANEWFTKSVEYNVKGYKSENYRNKSFYKFVKINDECVIDGVLSSIRLKHPSEFNDPMDCPIAQHDMMGLPDKTILNGLKIGCFGVVKDSIEFYRDAWKWTFYGDWHRGICVCYDFSNFDFSDNTIFSRVVYSSTHNASKGIVGGNILTKSIWYSNEDEWRIVRYEKNEKVDYVTININHDNIKKVFIGYKCPKNFEKYICEKLKDYKSVRIYRMVPSEKNFFSLVCKRLR